MVPNHPFSSHVESCFWSALLFFPVRQHATANASLVSIFLSTHAGILSLEQALNVLSLRKKVVLVCARFGASAVRFRRGRFSSLSVQQAARLLYLDLLNLLLLKATWAGSKQLEALRFDTSCLGSSLV